MKFSNLVFCTAILACGIISSACSDEETEDSDTESNSDTDTDGDSGTDTDSDTDTNTDTDSDTNTDMDSDSVPIENPCPVGIAPDDNDNLIICSTTTVCFSFPDATGTILDQYECEDAEDVCCYLNIS